MAGKIQITLCSECRECGYARNAINGTLCMRLKRYIDYCVTPPCKGQTDFYCGR